MAPDALQKDLSVVRVRDGLERAKRSVEEKFKKPLERKQPSQPSVTLFFLNAMTTPAKMVRAKFFRTLKINQSLGAIGVSSFKESG